MNELEHNQQVADVICRDFEWQGRKFQLGDCVVLLEGEVVAVAPDLDQALQTLRDIEPDPRRGMLVEVRKPVFDVVRRGVNLKAGALNAGRKERGSFFSRARSLVFDNYVPLPFV